MEGYNSFCIGPMGKETKQGQGNASSRSFLGTINVIFVALGKTGSHPSRVMSVARPHIEDSNFKRKRAKVEIRPELSFLDEDKIEPYSHRMML